MTAGRAALLAAFETTWPPAERYVAGGIATGRGLGAGGRVSSSRALSPDWTGADLAAAEAQHRDWGQPPLFRVPDDDAALAAALSARGYHPTNPTAILWAEVAALADPPPGAMTAFDIWPPLAVQRQIWCEGAIGPARQAVMDRVRVPHVSLLGRVLDRPAGAAFVAADGPVAMLHALEIRPAMRRNGLGGDLVRAAAVWSAAQGAERLALAVSLGNQPAMGLYRRLGFVEAGRYTYYAAPASGG